MSNSLCFIDTLALQVDNIDISYIYVDKARKFKHELAAGCAFQ